MGPKEEDDGHIPPTPLQTKVKRPKDKMNEIIGEMGRWQLQNIIIVFVIGIPGLAHIYSSVFVAAKSDFWCSDFGEDKEHLTYTGNVENAPLKNHSLVNYCPESCDGDYTFDKSFWTSTLKIQFNLVCDRKHLATLAKMTLFAGFGAGTFGAGLISDVGINCICMQVHFFLWRLSFGSRS